MKIMLKEKDMKKLFIAVLSLMPLFACAQTVLTPEQKVEQAQKQLEQAQKALEAAKAAQEKAEQKGKDTDNGKDAASDWTVPAEEKTGQQQTTSRPPENKARLLKEDPRYLDGAVPVNEQGDIVFSLDLHLQDLDKLTIYNKILEYLTHLTSDQNELRGSRVALVNKNKGVIAATVKEWLVFTNTALSLDRTEINYTIIAKCKDGNASIAICRINYNYEEGRSTGFKDAAENVITDKYGLNRKHTKLARGFGKFRKKTIDRKDEIFSDIRNLFK